MALYPTNIIYGVFMTITIKNGTSTEYETFPIFETDNKDEAEQVLKVYQEIGYLKKAKFEIKEKEVFTADIQDGYYTYSHIYDTGHRWNFQLFINLHDVNVADIITRAIEVMIDYKIESSHTVVSIDEIGANILQETAVINKSTANDGNMYDNTFSFYRSTYLDKWNESNKTLTISFDLECDNLTGANEMQIMTLRTGGADMIFISKFVMKQSKAHIVRTFTVPNGYRIDRFNIQTQKFATGANVTVKNVHLEVSNFETPWRPSICEPNFHWHVTVTGEAQEVDLENPIPLNKRNERYQMWNHKGDVNQAPDYPFIGGFES